VKIGRLLLLVSLLVIAPGGASPIAQESERPVDSGIVEEERVQLVIIDVVVVDKQGRTVPGLTADDFVIKANGARVPVDALDVNCPDGAVAEPRGVRLASKRELPDSANVSRRIVLAIDYLHMPPIRRPLVLEYARKSVRDGTLPGDEIMVVALNGGLRIEQPFTSDPDEVVKSLRRMEYDVTLWQPDYFHTHEAVFVDPMVALLDLLGRWHGNKAVVLFSEMEDVPLDLEFARIAAIAATSRCSIYPVDSKGLRVPEAQWDIGGGG